MLVQDVHRRGHQFRVETTFHRLTAPLDYILYSPSIEEVHRQPRIQTEPLILAPKAGYYQEDPVVVLDFRSLYPSVTIAYNLCYSTCLGVLREGGSLEGRLGVDLRYKTDLPALQREDVLFSPSGAMFVPASCREGLLPRLLRLVLDTRFEVQAALEHVAGPAGDTEAQVQLKARQFALKMLANTAYGYTAASFTGRMPCVDLAEAIVSLGRLTLERAIRQIEDTPAWGAEVLYGDTDSIFVLLKGRSRAEAFVMGETIAAAITAANPSPVRLQFEKVLQPTLLLVKKRYAGYMWTSPQQTTPTFLAKGIETVRRDQCAATAKVARRLLVSLFDGADPRTLHGLYTKEVSKFQRGVCDPYECIFRRAVKLQRYAGKDVSHLPLGAHLALQEMQKDMARTPYWGERLPYVVARSLHSDRLKDRVVHPERLLEVSCEGEKGWSIDAEYYITKHLNAAVDRLLLGVHLSASRWFREMPRRYHNSALLRVSDFRRVERRRIKSREEKGLPGSTISERTITPLSREEPSTVAHKRSRPSTDELDVISIDSSVEEIQRDSTIVCSDNSEVGSPPVRARTLDGYYQHLQCVVCGAGMMNPREQNRRITSYMHGGDAHRPATGEAAPLHTLPPTCEACWSDPQRLLLHVMAGYHLLGRRLAALRRVCQSCIGGTMDIEDCAVAAVSPHIVQAKVRETDLTCTSTDCELNFEKTRVTELYIQYELWGWFLRQYFW
ncbi:DNA polymerase zeta subunit [Angomonas deanei]|uniref:DNA-directed DNA polymerase n=1 Tax=Angomonas deanei TaxID=59799 RepID=A0A7G2CMZ4_9TRYP|nr:DNA polymerase zeta subunit [Angomonas deanei]CAD2220779.1 DNA polymerase family B/C4-type zinc-finger of DNA polymerase delta, putative [Angomonas deanei]|eukprot:EPY21438.1 DNA polymerase zeta subunit [Angomonas deanei]